MGVLGLWTLLEPVGKPVALETLENKVLAVDVSIWLHQATKGFRDASGNPLPNAHLLGVFHRVCKLLYYRIKPVFVFDGGVPQLKKQTISSRHNLRHKANRTASKLSEKLLMNYIRSEVVSGALGGTGRGRGRPGGKKTREKDMFELPPTPATLRSGDEADGGPSSRPPSDSDFEDDSSSSFETESSLSAFTNAGGQDIHSLDVTTKDFLSLPAHVQHEILTNLKETRKQNSWAKIGEMPKESDSFSSFQMERLLRRRCLQQRLDEVSQEISRQQNDYSAGGFQPPSKGHVESRRLVSDSSTHYILFKKDKGKLKEDENLEDTPREVEVMQEIPFVRDTFLDSDDDDLTQEQILAVIQSADKAKSPSDLTPQAAEVELSDTSDSEGSFLEVPDSRTDDVSTTIHDEDDIFADVFQNDVQQPPPVEAVSPPRAVTRTLKVSEPAESSRDHLEALTNRDNVSVSLPVTPANSEKDESSTDNISVIKIIEEPPEAQVKFVPFNSADEPTTSALKKIEEPPKAPVKVVSFTAEDVPPEETVIREPERKPAVDQFTQDLQKMSSAGDTERLAELHATLLVEQQNLAQQRAQQERMGASLNDEMYVEVQELLRLFGIPFIVAPMEAEAQCAFLDQENITDGSITDDSDVWLFGGRRVYKNFFNQGKYVQYFEVQDIQQVFHMGRDKLVSLALLTGSDYTEGIESVGPVTALEILAEFPAGNGIESLKRFAAWLRGVQSRKNAPPENKIRQKLRNLQLRPGFPSEAVVEAYLRPEINDSKDRFSWLPPDADGLREFARHKLGWNGKATDAVLLPVLQRYAEKNTQTRIDSFFRSHSNGVQGVQMSKRVLEALKRADFSGSPDDSNGELKMGSAEPKEETATKKRKRTVATRVTSAASPPADQSLAAASFRNNEEFKRKKLEANKLKAIEIFKKSKAQIRGKKTTEKKPAKIVDSTAYLSESDSD